MSTFLLLALACGAEPENSVQAALDGPPSRVPARHVETAATSCDVERTSNPPSDSSSAGCRSDEQCTAGKNGRCRTAGLAFAECSYDECTADADCGAGFCDCRRAPSTAANRCVTGSECRVDADCGGPYCSPSLVPDGCGGSGLKLQGYYCHSSRDECIDDADCKRGDAMGGATCDYDLTRKKWRCSVRKCVSD